MIAERTDSIAFGEPGHAERYAAASKREQPEGFWFTGVKTTKIYCLPSCPARQPKAENVIYFRTAEAAEAYGLRPCKRCKPDRLAFHDEERNLREAIQKLPLEANGEALARSLGIGATKLNQDCHAFYHSTPAHLLALRRTREAAKRLLASDGEVGEIGLECGFESSSTFFAAFRRFTGLTPGEFQKLRSATSFAIRKPENFRESEWLDYISRDPQSVTERVEGERYRFTFWRDKPVLVDCHIGGDSIQVESNEAVSAHHALQRLLGLEQDLDGFAALCRQSSQHVRLLPAGLPLVIPQTPTVWASIVWAILGQQVNVPFAAKLRGRIAETYGEKLDADLYCEPSPTKLASLTPEDLRPLQISSGKANYIIGAARLVESGHLDAEALPYKPASEVERILLGIKGIGPWAANYIMLRGCGFLDCTPLGDTGLTSALARHFEVARPGPKETLALMEAFRPYRSLATYHLWRSLRKEGA